MQNVESEKLQNLEYFEDKKSLLDDITFFIVFKELSSGEKIKQAQALSTC